MSDQHAQQSNDNRLADLNRKASCIVGGLFLAVVGFLLISERSNLQLPDRNKLWADYWKKELSKRSGLPEMKPAFDSQQLEFDAEASERRSP
jgi:hypothetical protein